MNLKTLAQDVFDKKQDVSNKRLALSRANLALSDAKTTLSSALASALCGAEAAIDEQVAINLPHKVAICEWDGDSEYTVSFISKAPNANT